MGLKIFVVVFLFLIVFVNAAETSFTELEFTIEGCSVLGYPNGLAPGVCSANGRYFCGDDLTLYNTLQDENGCSFGDPDYTGGLQCCPPGYFCNPSRICESISTNCELIVDDEGGCESNNCFWLENECKPYAFSYGCSIYETNLSCSNDNYGLGKRGFGTEGCEMGYYWGENPSFVVNDCKCVWNETACLLSKNITEEIYKDDPIKFLCEEYFNMGECGENFLRKVNVTANLIDINSGDYHGYVEQNICKDYFRNISCGISLVKLPGFSFFALVFSCVLIFVFYYWKFFRKRENSCNF